MGGCVPMFGFDSRDTANLRRRFSRIPQKDREWTCVEDFMQWAKESGYTTGLHMRKINELLSHGPDNSYWVGKGSEAAKKRFSQELKKGCEFCRECIEEFCTQTHGCREWQKYFVENWNKNIHVPKDIPPEPEKPMVWRYEHPDLVREGIVFEGSCRL